MVFTIPKTRGLFYQFLMVVLTITSGKALAGFNLDLTGSGTKSSAGLTSNNDNSVTASVGLDLGEHFQLGLSHRVSQKVGKSGGCFASHRAI